MTKHKPYVTDALINFPIGQTPYNQFVALIALGKALDRQWEELDRDTAARQETADRYWATLQDANAKAKAMELMVRKAEETLKRQEAEEAKKAAIENFDLTPLKAREDGTYDPNDVQDMLDQINEVFEKNRIAPEPVKPAETLEAVENVHGILVEALAMISDLLGKLKR